MNEEKAAAGPKFSGGSGGGCGGVSWQRGFLAMTRLMAVSIMAGVFCITVKNVGGGERKKENSEREEGDD